MIYRNSNIPNNYNKIAEISDNYIVWVKESNLDSNHTYNAYVQYFKPNFYLIYLEDYTIKKGTNYNLIPNYSNNGMYTYIIDYDLEYNLKTNELVSGDDYSTKLDYIADYNEINISFFVLIVCLLFILKQCSKLWAKGGCL